MTWKRKRVRGKAWRGGKGIRGTRRRQEERRKGLTEGEENDI